jgi:hypothetical protein
MCFENIHGCLSISYLFNNLDFILFPNSSYFLDIQILKLTIFVYFDYIQVIKIDEGMTTDV